VYEHVCVCVKERNERNETCARSRDSRFYDSLASSFLALALKPTSIGTDRASSR
jgi:hypothetical protein